MQSAPPSSTYPPLRLCKWLIALFGKWRELPKNRVDHPHKRGVKGERILEKQSLLSNSFQNIPEYLHNLGQASTMWDVRCSTLNMKERRMWSLPSRSLRVARSVASRESGSTLDIFTFHSYNESFTSSTWNNHITRPWIPRGNADSFFLKIISNYSPPLNLHGFIESPGRHQIWNWDSCRCLAALSSVYLWPANVSSKKCQRPSLPSKTIWSRIGLRLKEEPAHCQRRCLSCNLDAGLPSVAPIPEKNFWNAILLKAGFATTKAIISSLAGIIRLPEDALCPDHHLALLSLTPPQHPWNGVKLTNLLIVSRNYNY